MEMQADTMLSAQAGRIEHYPDLKRRIEEHPGETKRQAELRMRRREAAAALSRAIDWKPGRVIFVQGR